MNPDLFAAELEASRSLVELIEQAKKTQVLYERAQMSLPEPLRRLLGMNGVGGRASSPANIQAPEAPPMPPEAESDWAWIKGADASPASLVMATIRSAKRALRPRDIIERVVNILPEVPAGSIYNVGPRLEKQGILHRGEEGWALTTPESAGIIYKGYFWGPASAFTKQEQAAQRRATIIHILGFHPTGLQIVQIVQQLKRCPWVIGSINKDLLKEDVAILSEAGKIRRRGNTRNWELVRQRES